MLVRKAKSDDLNSIMKFQLAMAKETESIDLEHDVVKKGIDAVLKDPTKGNYYVAEIDNKVIASLLTTFEWSDWRNGTVLWIQSVYVLPEFRRKGAYSKLYEHIKRLVINDHSLKGIRLYADSTNLAAHNTYEKLGMSPDHYITFEWLK